MSQPLLVSCESLNRRVPKVKSYGDFKKRGQSKELIGRVFSKCPCSRQFIGLETRDNEVECPLSLKAKA